jgi:hypothetical protein
MFMQEYGYGMMNGNIIDVDASLFNSKFGNFEVFMKKGHGWNVCCCAHTCDNHHQGGN